MLSRYTSIVYCPDWRDRLHLIPQRRMKWGQVFSDIKSAWNWLKDKVSPSVPNPFDAAWDEVLNSLLFEGA
ncbi:MAG TPA: hypothetical protein V6C65_26865 [Allocoleopsis sp.]